jgi:acyl-CoA thioesterase-1
VGSFIFGIALLAVAAVVFLGWLVFMAFIRSPSGSDRSAKAGSLVCIGDSLTHASLSGDFVSKLRQDLSAKAVDVVNAGQNGDTSKAVAARAGRVSELLPAFVTIQVGVNDVLRDRTEETPKLLGENLRVAVEKLRSRSNPRIAILSIAPLGEQLTDELNQCIKACNQTIEQTASAMDLAYLPLGESLAAQISTAGEVAGGKPIEAFRFGIGPLLSSAFQHYVLRRSFDEIGQRAGRMVHSDGIHLADRSADIARSLILGWILKALD